MAYSIEIAPGSNSWSVPQPDQPGELWGYALRADLRISGNHKTVKAMFLASIDDICPHEWVPVTDLRVGRPTMLLQQAQALGTHQGMVCLYLTRARPLPAVLVVAKVRLRVRPLDTDCLQEAVVSGQRPAQRPYVPLAPLAGE